MLFSPLCVTDSAGRTQWKIFLNSKWEPLDHITTITNNSRSGEGSHDIRDVALLTWTNSRVKLEKYKKLCIIGATEKCTGEIDEDMNEASYLEGCYWCNIIRIDGIPEGAEGTSTVAFIKKIWWSWNWLENTRLNQECDLGIEWAHWALAPKVIHPNLIRLNLRDQNFAFASFPFSNLTMPPNFYLDSHTVTLILFEHYSTMTF